MTRYFEVLRRDGPARKGKLMLDVLISTPAIISEKDYSFPGSAYDFGSMEEVLASSPISEKTKKPAAEKLAILPYVPSALHVEPPFDLPDHEIEGPKGFVLHPFYIEKPKKADVYVMAGAGSLRNPRDLISAVIGVRAKIPSDTALYAPALATPANLAFLIYLGIDLIDATRVIADTYFGRYHTRDGVKALADFDELPCRCQHCQRLAVESENTQALVGHNVQKLEEELALLREMVRKETIREYVERQVRVTPELTAALRLLDQEHKYLEARAPQYRRSILYANTAESLCRVEVTRFAHRVLERYSAPKSDVLLLLPCSARKPYSKSRSHRFFALAIGSHRRYLHELILTSPLALVPRELEEVYPAANYDVPVIGHWDLEERAWLCRCLDAYLKKNKYTKIIAHLEGELEQTVKEHGIDAAFTGGGTNETALSRLSEAIQDACQGTMRLGDKRVAQYKAVADYYFGSGAGDLLLAGKVKVKGREIQEENGKALAMMTPNGSIALSLTGARRLEPMEKYIVTIGDFLPKGSLLAPGVTDADEQIRPGDEVIIRGEKAFGIGRAKMSGWEMVESTRGVAVELKHIQEI
jgi:archaeosine synthase